MKWSGGFTQRNPNDGDEPSQPTSCKILYDNNYIYIAIRVHDSEPENIVTRLSRRDGFEGEWVEVNIDSYFDKRTAYSFTASASGVKGDEAITNNGNNRDSEWDPVWYLEKQIYDKGWVAEMKIPLSQLRFNDEGPQVWGIQFTRRLYRRVEISIWRYVPQKEAGWLNNFGELLGIKDIIPKKHIEVSPCTVIQLEKFKDDKDNPFTTGQDWNNKIGLNGKVGVTN